MRCQRRRVFPGFPGLHGPTARLSGGLLRALLGCAPGGVLWLNGDVVFDPAVLEHALPAIRAGENAVCVNSAAVGDEEIKYTVDADGCVRELSKTVVGGLGEAVGINHVCAAGVRGGAGRDDLRPRLRGVRVSREGDDR